MAGLLGLLHCQVGPTMTSIHLPVTHCNFGHEPHVRLLTHLNLALSSLDTLAVEALHNVATRIVVTRDMVCSIQAAGAIIDSSVQPCTQYIVAAEDIPAKVVAQKLGLDLETDSFPKGKFLVSSKFPSSCNAERKLLDPEE